MLFRSIEWVKAVVTGVRNIRGEMDIAPSKRLRAMLQDGSAIDRERWQQNAAAVMTLAGLASLEWLDANEPLDENATATSLVGQMKILIPFGSLIDKQAEEDRLLREREKLEQNLARARAKLANQSFVERAPKDIVEQEHRRVIDFEAAVGELDKQLARIRNLPS